MTASARDRASARRALVLGVVCLTLGFAMLAARDRVVRGPLPLINVRWASALDDTVRADLEQRLHLRPIEPLEGTVWRYELEDTASDSIEAIVRHPEVADTDQIDRSRFSVAPTAHYGPRVPGPLVAGWPRIVYLALAASGPVLLTIGVLTLTASAWPARTRAVRSGVAAWALRGIPPMSAHSLAAFRTALGITLALYVWTSEHVPPDRAVEARSVYADLTALPAVRSLAARPPVIEQVMNAGAISALLFAAGVVPRLTYAVTAAAIVVWMWATMATASSHPYSVLIFPLLALLAVPWHHTPPLHRWLRGGEPGARVLRYGYAPWLLSLALGVAFAAAAWSKVREGAAWITTGSVKYAWLADADHAFVDWGVRLAQHRGTTVMLSAAAVAIEALVIVAAFSRSATYRLTTGVIALMLLAGFALLQGIIWPAWWVLLLGFVPWQWLDGRHAPAGAAGTLSRPQRFWYAFLVAQQLVISAAFIELPPFASRYDMYSTVHYE